MSLPKCWAFCYQAKKLELVESGKKNVKLKHLYKGRVKIRRGREDKGELIVFLLVLICSDALGATLDLKLVGPFEILAGAHKASKNSEPNLHLHWRFFFDPPEFQTILLGNQATQHHFGYYRY